MMYDFAISSTLVYLALTAMAVCRDLKYYNKFRAIVFCSWFAMFYFYVFSFMLEWHGFVLMFNLVAIIGNIAGYSMVKKLEQLWK